MPSIASRAKGCLAQLGRLVGLLEEPDQELIGLSATEVVDTLGRFRIWAANIGALQDIHTKSSLAYRLRDAPKIARQITELLDELAESLEDVHSIASHGRENRTGALHEAELNPSVQVLESTDDTEHDKSDEEELSEIREIFASIDDAINNLFRFSIIIRNNTSRDRYAKAAAAAITNPFNDQFDICHVEHKFPTLRKRNDRWLIDRLGRAVTQRRQYLKYCREHHDKTAKEPPSAEPGTLVMRNLEASSQMPTTLIPSARSDYSKPTSTLAPTQASTLILTSDQVIEEVVEDTQSQTSYATSTDEENSNATLSVIKLEEVSKGFKQFECPYCWQIQTARNQRAWKKHVLSDLKPYVCTFEDCELKLFSDRHTWFSHELKDHRQEWRCYFCSHYPFENSDSYQRHLASHHPESFVKAQLPALLEMSQKALSKLSPTDCPFCDDWEQRLRIINPHIPATEALAVTPSQFQHHLGAHMEQLALFAIPRGYTEEGEADSGNAAPQIDSNASSLGNSDASSTLARELRLCEDIMNELTEQAHLGYLSELTTILSFYLWIPGHGRIMISPLSIPRIVQKLESGEYRNAADLFLDMNVLFTLLDFTHESGTHGDVRLLFDTLWENNIGNPHGNDLRTRLKQEMMWKFWSATQLSNDPIDVSPGNVLITMKMQSGEIVSRFFNRASSIEHLYMFADCYELIYLQPPTPLPPWTTNYRHNYQFMLNLAENTTTSGKCRLDPNISIGELVDSSPHFVVLELGIGESPQISGMLVEPPLEATGKSPDTSSTQQSNSNQIENLMPSHASDNRRQDAIENENDGMVGNDTQSLLGSQEKGFTQPLPDSRPSSPAHDLSGWEFDPWNSQSRRYRINKEGPLAYEYKPPAPEPGDDQKAGTLVIIVLRARNLSDLGNGFYDVRLGNGGDLRFARSSSVSGSVAEWNNDFSFDVGNFGESYDLAVAVESRHRALVGNALINLGDLIVPCVGQRRGWYNLDNNSEKPVSIKLDIRFYPSTPTTATDAGSSEPTPKDPIEEWVIAPADKQKFDSIYNTLDKDNKGYITGEEVVPFFSESNLPEVVLAKIGDLADMNSVGQLTRDEFAVAMHLIRQQRNKPGGEYSLPDVLPSNLVPPSMRPPHSLVAEVDENPDEGSDENELQKPVNQLESRRFSSLNVNTVGLSSETSGDTETTSMRRRPWLSAEFDENLDEESYEYSESTNPARFGSLSVNTVGLSSKQAEDGVVRQSNPVSPDTEPASPDFAPVSPIREEDEPPISTGASRTRPHSFLESDDESQVSVEATFPGPSQSHPDAEYWTVEQVAYFLSSNGFSDNWQRTFQGLNITGSEFLNLGSGHPGKKSSTTMLLKVYPRLNEECNKHGTGLDQTREREEGKRLRRLIRGLTTGKNHESEIQAPETTYPSISVAVDYFDVPEPGNVLYKSLKKGDIVTVVETESNGLSLVQTSQGAGWVPSRCLSTPAPPNARLLQQKPLHSTFLKRVLLSPANSRSDEFAHVCLVEMLLDTQSDLNCVSDKAVAALEADSYPTLSHNAEMFDSETSNPRETTLFFRDAGGGLTQEAKFFITSHDFSFQVMLGNTDAEKFQKISPRLIERRPGPESKAVVVDSETDQETGPQPPEEIPLVNNTTPSRIDQDREALAGTVEQTNLPEGKRRRPSTNTVLSHVGLFGGPDDRAAKITQDIEYVAPYRRGSDEKSNVQSEIETPIGFKSIHQRKTDLGDFVATLSLRSDDKKPGILKRAANLFKPTSRDKRKTPTYQPPRPGDRNSGTTSLGYETRSGPGIDWLRPIKRKVSTGRSSEFDQVQNLNSEEAAPRLPNDIVEKAPLFPAPDADTSKETSMKPTSDDDKRRFAKTLAAIGNHLGTPGENNDDSKSDLGKSLDYPDIPSKYHNLEPAEGQPSSSKIASPKDNRPTVIANTGQYACSACYIPDDRPILGYVCGHLLHKQCYEKASGCPICLERRGAWRDDASGNYPTGYEVLGTG